METSNNSPEKNLCYIAPNVGTFWLQGTTASGQNKSCATFVWYHGITDFDTHCQELLYKDNFETTNDDTSKTTWLHYTMDTRNENGTSTKVVGEQARIYYRRDGDGENTPADMPLGKPSPLNDKGFILWSWNAVVFDGHEDD
jgi:hypothetical protein